MTAAPQGAWVWVDGRPVPGAEARVPVFDRGLLYGDSVYEVTRTVAGRALFLTEHLARLQRSAAGLEMAPLPAAEVGGAVIDTIAALRADTGGEAYVRVVVTRGAGEISLDPAAADRPRLLVIVKPLRLPDTRLYAEGAALVVVSWRRNAPGHVPAWIKSGNYLTSVLAMAEVRRRGAYEALMTAPDGQISEGASSNFYLVRAGQAGPPGPGWIVETPPESAGLLCGVTRQVVLGLLRGRGVEVQERPLYPADVAAADEAFLTSSVRGVMPVVRLDEQQVGGGRPGSLTGLLMRWYGEHIGEPPPALPEGPGR